jgi:hypothetical protein
MDAHCMKDGDVAGLAISRILMRILPLQGKWFKEPCYGITTAKRWFCSVRIGNRLPAGRSVNMTEMHGLNTAMIQDVHGFAVGSIDMENEISSLNICYRK